MTTDKEEKIVRLIVAIAVVSTILFAALFLHAKYHQQEPAPSVIPAEKSIPTVKGSAKKIEFTSKQGANYDMVLVCIDGKEYLTHNNSIVKTDRFCDVEK